MPRDKKKAQVWISDVTISIMLFTAAAIVAFTILMNSFSTGNEYSKIKSDASKLSEYILSEGTPADWNETNLIRPGLLSGKRLNFTKAYRAMNLSNSSYAALKPMLQTNYDFAAVFELKNGTIIAFQDYCSFGDPGLPIEKNDTVGLICYAVNFTRMHYHNMVRIDRFTVYNSAIVRMAVYMWN